ncbi:hypothetical protein HYW55_02390 [Candidatus Gottesmanbacteria bacterium]|nr:hypothetical protein [Candidatus Gottesmanbacteria bacterium]
MLDAKIEIDKEQLIQQFAHDVEETARGATIQYGEGEIPPLAYMAESAADIYGRDLWINACKKYTDHLGMLKVVESALQEKGNELTFDEALNILSELNSVLEKEGIRIFTAKAGASGRAKLVTKDSNRIEIDNALPANKGATLIPSTTPEVGSIKGKKIAVVKRDSNLKSNIIINEDMIRGQPYFAIAAALHEGGHVDEMKNGPEFTCRVGSDRAAKRVPITERQSTLAVLKFARDEFTRTQNPALVKIAAPHAAIYNQVVFGTNLLQKKV